MEKIPGVLMRGGTSKGVVLHGAALPWQGSLRDAAILSIFGSPDRRQVDGLGGAQPLTSKVAIVSRSARPDADVDYTFGQVGIEQPRVDYTVTCGNMAAAVGLFALDEGLVPLQEPLTRVRIYNTNTGKIILADVPAQGGRSRCTGECAIDGVPGNGAEIRLTFLEPGGAITGKLLPTGQAREQLQTEEGPIAVSLIDSGNMYAIVRAADFALSGYESAAEIGSRPKLMALIEVVRRAAAARLLACGAVDEALGRKLAITHKVALLAAGDGAGIDLSARIINTGRVHESFAVTGAIALGSAACVVGSLVGDFLPTRDSGPLVISHPCGRISVETSVSRDSGQLVIEAATVVRTARRIMDGHVYLHPEILQQLELASWSDEQPSVDACAVEKI